MKAGLNKFLIWYRINFRNKFFHIMFRKRFRLIRDSKYRITKEELIAIAHIGFPKQVKQNINFDNLGFMHWGGVYRLYDQTEGLYGIIPKETILGIFINDEDFVQITVEHRAFNHHAAIMEMVRMGII